MKLGQMGVHAHTKISSLSGYRNFPQKVIPSTDGRQDQRAKNEMMLSFFAEIYASMMVYMCM